MDKQKTLSTIGAVICSVMMPLQATQAAVVFNNGAPSIQSNSSDLEGTSIRAEDFSFASDTTIRSVNWSGVYYSNDTPTAPDDFTIRIFSENGGLPDPVGEVGLSPFSIGNAVNRVDSGDTAFGRTVYDYSANIGPTTLTAGVTYWISIFNNTSLDTDDNWNWSLTSSGVIAGSASAFTTNTNNWQGAATEMSFSLSDTQVSAVPVPAAVWLMGSALVGLIGFRRKQSA